MKKKKKKKQAGAMKTAITCSDVEKDSCSNKLESLENVKSKKTGQPYLKIEHMNDQIIPSQMRTVNGITSLIFFEYTYSI